VIELARRLTHELGRPIGVYPETKHPTYFASISLALEGPLVSALQRHGLDGADANVFVQSFEAGSLRAVARSVGVPLVQLLPTRDPGTPADLAEIARYAFAEYEQFYALGVDGLFSDNPDTAADVRDD
jgi:glycerophosphoryl diester phosphodiesterase